MICNNNFLADMLRICEIKEINMGDAFSKSLSIRFYLLSNSRCCIYSANNNKQDKDVQLSWA